MAFTFSYFEGGREELRIPQKRLLRSKFVLSVYRKGSLPSKANKCSHCQDNILQTDIVDSLVVAL